MIDKPRDDGTDPPRPIIERITVGLINKAADDLQKLQGHTGLSKTDLVNRAIALYEFISRQMDTEHEILIRDTVSGETQILRLL